MLLLYFLSDMYTEMSNLRTSLALCASVAWCAALCWSGAARWRGGADHQHAAVALQDTEGRRPPHWRCKERPKPHGRGRVVLLLDGARPSPWHSGGRYATAGPWSSLAPSWLSPQTRSSGIRPRPATAGETPVVFSLFPRILRLAALSIKIFNLALLLQLDSQNCHL
jgi:hypothetical protein